VSQLAVDRLKEQLGAAVIETHAHLGDDTVVVDASSWKAACELAKSDARLAFDMLVDLTAVDYPDREPRFEIVVHLASIAKRHRLRLKARVGGSEGEGAEIDSVTSVWPGANWLEREVYDMFGVTFRGHPDLRRILMYPEFEGHPLRKDYRANHIQPLVEFRTGNVEKLAPFRDDEGMSFGRQTHDHRQSDENWES
jgi:NADH-quinone oxidoreductase subunit C